MEQEFVNGGLEVYRLVVTPVAQNARIVVYLEGEPPQRKAIIIDPGGEAKRILAGLAQLKAQVASIWLTHSHFDHCGGVAGILRAHQVPLYAHTGESEFRHSIALRARQFGLPVDDMEDCPEPSNPLFGGENANWGPHKVQVKFVPGHAPGHLAFYLPDSGVIFSGDVLFATSIGRTDLPGGDYQTLMNSINSEIMVLPDVTKVFSGHGETVTIAQAMSINPFLQGTNVRSI